MKGFARPGGIVFDCDGVLIDSNRVKGAAFRAALAGESEPGIARFFADFHAWPGQTRFALFARYFRDSAGYADWERRVTRSSEGFATTMQEVLTACQPLPGIDRYLDWLTSEGVPCAVVSAAQKADLDRVVVARGWSRHFVRICGAERGKPAEIEALLADGLLKRPLLYFGDTIVDMEAAEAVGARFCFVSSASEWTDGAARCGERGHAVIADFEAAPRW
ncbi:HAD family hydrolase [Bosea sp. PAMC 26642]|uniref:HAD family hydrolase n=1 Tax=Bosea sp. (strain PAMC 26642) TaxID=1792307 RepID=UPI0007704F46|nr:HAD hydrolase-like protein [Bosea sp. PAMC 26642]AMJ61517.1 hypothetical protein AXW83_15485 [Bosea sp. PAMC 26642]